MIFSEEKWKKGNEQDANIPLSASLSFSKVAPSLANAQEMFLNPLLGSALVAQLESAYTKDNPDAAMATLLKMCQNAVVNLTLWYYFDLLQMRVTDQGFHRQGSEDWQQPYKYQEDRIREGFKHRGFNALDGLLDYLYDNVTTYPAFERSTAYTNKRGAVVRSKKDVEQLVYIGGSTLVFLRLRTEFPTIEENRLVAVMGRTLYDLFRGWLVSPETFPSEKCNCTLEDLRERCAAVVVRHAVVRVIQQTGSLTDRGLYFDATAATGGNDNSSLPAPDMAIGDRLSLYKSDASVAEDNLRRFLSRRMDVFFDNHTPHHIIRNNEGKQAFFAM